MSKYLTKDEVMDMFKITYQTLHRWRQEGKIPYVRVSSRKIVYREEDIKKLLNEKIPEEYKKEKMNVLYCRVSSNKQKEDLKKQEQLLRDFCNANGNTIDLCLSEVASGMNENRKEFNKLIDLVIDNQVENVFITFKDRLTRFGFDYFKNLFQKYDCKIVILNNPVNEDNFDNELTEDLIAIIHHFSMEMYSNRRNKLKDIEKSLNTMEKNNEKEDW